jgi:hypothetical protein
MATNWPPAPETFPHWPPEEVRADFFSCSTLQGVITYLAVFGFTRVTPTAAETTQFFTPARCDEGHTCNGIILRSPDGLRRYPFATCAAVTHKSALALWIVGYTPEGEPCYDIGYNSRGY